jgi:integrase
MPRGKDGIGRRFPLWPETAEAVRQAIQNRRKPKSAETRQLVFLTATGSAWRNASGREYVSEAFRLLAQRVGVYKLGRGFQSLRRMFETISGECLDQVATDYVMGHGSFSISSVYRLQVTDERLVRICQHVHDWLLP